MSRNLFWLSDEQWAADRAAFADRCARGRAGRMIAASSAASCMCSRAAVAGAIARSKPMALRRRSTIASSLGASRDLGEFVPGARRERAIGGHADDQLHARQSASLGGGRKRGEQKQAVGRSRGGRNTKIHALADAKGRLIAILLTGGEAHDCPVAERLIRRVKPPKRMLGDKAYDSAELREELDERGTKPVIPNRSNSKQPFSFSSASTNYAGASRAPSTG